MEESASHATFLRVHKGIPDLSHHFETLSDDPSDRFVWATTIDALSDFDWRNNALGVFHKVGFETWYMQKKKKEGFVFSALVFKAVESDAIRATWSGLREVAKRLGITCDDSVWRETSLIECKVDSLPFFTVSALKERNETHVSDPTVMRGFLYHGLGARELFRGDGFAWNQRGERGVPEFLVRNCKRHELKDLEVVQLNVDNL
jgi:hypothetical protein